MLKAAGEDSVEAAREPVEAVFSNGTTPRDWEESVIINLFKGKGEALERGNYCGLKLIDQAMKLRESDGYPDSSNGGHRRHAVQFHPR